MRIIDGMVEVIEDDGCVVLEQLEDPKENSGMPQGWEDQLYEEWRDRDHMEAEMAEGTA